jgi:hypothetical protein
MLSRTRADHAAGSGRLACRQYVPGLHRHGSLCRPPPQIGSQWVSAARREDKVHNVETGHITGTQVKDYEIIWFTGSCQGVKVSRQR